MSHNEHVADHVVEIAARRMHNYDPEVRALAGEVMRLAQNRPPVGSLGHFNALTMGRRYAGAQKSAFEGTLLEDRQRSALADVLRSAPGANRLYK
jgi:hypothetical protein